MARDFDEVHSILKTARDKHMEALRQVDKSLARAYNSEALVLLHRSACMALSLLEARVQILPGNEGLAPEWARAELDSIGQLIYGAPQDIDEGQFNKYLDAVRLYIGKVSQAAARQGHVIYREQRT